MIVYGTGTWKQNTVGYRKHQWRHALPSVYRIAVYRRQRVNMGLTFRGGGATQIWSNMRTARQSYTVPLCYSVASADRRNVTPIHYHFSIRGTISRRVVHGSTEVCGDLLQLRDLPLDEILCSKKWQRWSSPLEGPRLMTTKSYSRHLWVLQLIKEMTFNYFLLLLFQFFACSFCIAFFAWTQTHMIPTHY